MPLFDSLDELKAQFFGDHELQSVFIDDNFDDTVVKLCEKAVIRAEKNAKKDDKSKLAKAASKKQPPKGKNKSAQKRNAEALGEKEPTSKKQKISEEKTLKPKAGESTAANLSNSQLKKEQKRSGQGNSLLSVKPEEKDVPQEEAQSSPQEATECKEGKEAQIVCEPSTSTSQQGATSTTSATTPRNVPIKRMMKIPKIKHNVVLSKETDALLDLAGVSLATPSKKILRKSGGSLEKAEGKSPLNKSQNSPKKLQGNNTKRNLRRDNMLAKKYSMERRETMNHQSPLQIPSYLKDKMKHVKDTFRAKDAKPRKDRKESPQPTQELWSGDVWMEDFDPVVTNSEAQSKRKKDLCQCFRRDDHDKTCFQPFICTHELEDVGMSILKFNKESLQMDLKFCEDSFCDKTFFHRRVRSLLSIDDYIPKQVVQERIAKAEKEVDFLLVYFWDCADNEVHTIRRLYHSLKCGEVVAVLTGLDEDPAYSSYLLPYTTHEALPPSMASRKLNFIGSEAGQPAFIFVIAKNPEPDTQSSAVSSTAVLPAELNDLPDGVLDSEEFDWKSGLLSVGDLVTMCRRTNRSDRKREYIDWFVECFHSADLDFDQRNIMLLSLKERSLLSANSQRWLQLRDAPSIEYEVDPDLEAVFHKSLRPHYGFMPT